MVRTSSSTATLKVAGRKHHSRRGTWRVVSALFAVTASFTFSGCTPLVEAHLYNATGRTVQIVSESGSVEIQRGEEKVLRVYPWPISGWTIVAGEQRWQYPGPPSTPSGPELEAGLFTVTMWLRVDENGEIRLLRRRATSADDVAVPQPYGYPIRAGEPSKMIVLDVEPE